MRHHARGFTLIELLIVVAIIAILAAIAVPNLLEAQTRSKVSRVKADLRTYSTAMEAYAVDNNEYPPLFLPPSGFKALEEVHIPLSTPVGYIGDAHVAEPFNSRQGVILYQGWDVIAQGANRPPDYTKRRMLYLMLPLPNDQIVGLYLGVVASLININDLPPRVPAITMTEVRNALTFEVPSRRWYIISPGPDTFFYFDQLYGTPTFSTYQNLIKSIATTVAYCSTEAFNAVYDPSNGTVSRGDIVRTGAGFFGEKK